MNRQPYGSPPRRWNPKLNPTWVKLTQRYRWRKLRREQLLESVSVEGLCNVQRAISQNQGVLLAPNHSTHFDSAALYVGLDRISQPAFIMTAWQVFSMSTPFERWFMQRMGCFSIDRESTDRIAFKHAIHMLRSEPFPLVIFPEGEIYHVTDRVTPFREGAAAIALSAAKRSERPIVVIPCAIKFWYLDDPTQHLLGLTERLEERVFLRTEPSLDLTDRIHRLAEGVLALKELDFLGTTRSGRVRDRIAHLADAVLTRMEQRYSMPDNDDAIPQRVKELRQRIIRQSEDRENDNGQDADGELKLKRDMDDLFFVMQLYSYPGDYLDEEPSIERIAETLDKLEEDLLDVELPSVRGRRRVAIRFGEPMEIEGGGDRRKRTESLTQTMQSAVQSLLDDLNAQPGDMSPISRVSSVQQSDSLAT